MVKKKMSLPNYFILPLLLFTLCSQEVSEPPYREATLATDCSKVVVAFNYGDRIVGLTGSHRINERYDLILCDSTAKPIDTLISQRTLNGHNTSVSDLYYDPSDGFICICSYDLYNGECWMEFVYPDGTIRKVDEAIFRQYSNKHVCGRKNVWWSDSLNSFYVVDVKQQ
jgi:hypothetical protein